MDEGQTTARDVLAEAGLLPRELPNNYTFDKVREMLAGMEDADPERIRDAVRSLQGLGIRGPLAAAVFVRHHLGGAHEVEVDRVAEGEEGARFAVLVYPEGEVPVPVEVFERSVDAGSRLRYDPSEERYVPK